MLNAQVHVNAVSSTVSTCPNNGTITVDAISPSPPLLYSITAGPVTQQVQTNPVFNSLPAGNYTVKISDGAGNEVLKVVTIGGNYQNPAFTAVPTSPYCAGEGNGKLVVNLTTGTGLAPYSYELISPSPVTETQNDNVFENLPAGNYSVRVTDACGSIRTNAITILPPDTKIYVNTQPSFIKIGCDSMLIRYTIHTKSPRFPFSFRYETSNGTYIPPAGATIIDSSRVHTHGWIDIQEIIPGMTYGDFVQVNVTNSCGERASNMNASYPFNFYPRYSYNECGSSVNASYDITPNNRTDIHTSLKQPITYTYIDLSTGDTVASDTYSHPNYLFSRQGVSIQGGVVIPGKTYRLTLTDGCGQTFIQNYTIPTQAAPTLTPAINAIACIDSVVGTFGISFSGFGPGVRMVVLSGPSTLGSTKPEFSYSDTYTWPSDTLYPSGSRFYLNNLAPGTYQYRVMDNCGRELTRTLNVNMSQSLSRGVRIEKGCPGENKLVYHLIGKGKITVKSLPDNTILKTSSIDNFIVLSGQQPKRDSILNLPSGQYEITYDYEHNIVNPLNDTPIPCWKIIDTITIPPYQNPEISVGNGIMCDDQISIELIPDITKGVPPFQYEIYSGPEIFPLQNSGVFPVSTVGTYYARIFDKCENASMKQITIDTLSFDPIDLTPDCKSKKVVFPRSMYFTYQWLLPDGQIYTGDSLVIHPVTPADTGNYEIRRITNINGCTDTVKLTYHIDLPNYSERTISFCEGTTVVIDGHVYDTPGVYTDTLVTASGCDSLVVTTLMLLPQLSDTSVVSICDGDSVLISGNYYSASGFYIDSTQNTHGCYDLQVTELIVIGQFPVNQYVTLCNNESYSFGNNSYNTTGVYYDTIQSSLGCDSIVVLHLDVLPEITHVIHATICEGDYYVFSGDVLSAGGTYTDTLLSVYSCDSVVTLYLNVLPKKYNSISISICEGESFYFGGQTLALAGIYKDTIQTNSCDSIVTLDLVILPHKYYQVYDTICEGADYVFGGLHYLQSGVYTHTFPTSSCDSIVTLNLTVVPAPSVLVTSVILDGNNESAVVRLNVVSTTSPLTYFWESSSGLSDNGIKNPTITIKDTEWVTLTVTDNYGCTARFEHRIELPITSTLYIPNAVTPDGNELNNIFRVYGTNISTFHIVIFNRWGEIIFESHDFNFGWDASYKGAVVQDGVYTYKLFAIGADGVQYNKTGHITVIK